MKKVIGFNGSPRVGFNTETLVGKVLEGAEKAGAGTKLFNLDRMDIKPCRGCMACRRDGVCSIKDDMTELISEIKSSNAIVLGSPVYMLQMTAQTKTFVDRLFPLIRSDFSSVLKEGTKAALVFTQGAENSEAFANYFEHTENMFKHFGFSVEKTLVAGNTGAKGDVEKQEELIVKAEELGRKLAQ